MLGNILVIDDEPLILSSIERALQRVGYEVTTANDMRGFQDALTSKRFDLVIMDLHMKDFNANQLIKEIKETTPHIKFLTISGSVPPQNSKYFLQKPFKIDVLRERVREILDEPS